MRWLMMYMIKAEFESACCVCLACVVKSLSGFELNP